MRRRLDDAMQQLVPTVRANQEEPSDKDGGLVGHD